jgi:hypothetical protein
MIRNVYGVLYVVVMIGVIVSADLLFFRNRFWERLIVNIGVTLRSRVRLMCNIIFDN